MGVDLINYSFFFILSLKCDIIDVVKGEFNMDKMERAKEKARSYFKSISDDFSLNNIGVHKDVYSAFSNPVPYKVAKKHLEKILDEKRATFYYTKDFTVVNGKVKDVKAIVVIYELSEEDLIDAENVDANINKVMDKINKLLALANGGANEHECLTASLKAQELINKYHIENVGSDEEDNIITSSFSTESGNLWKVELAKTVARNYYCIARFTRDYKKIVFLGRESDAVLARKVFSFLFTECKRFANKYAYKNRNYSASFKTTYCIGFCDGVAKELDKQCFALQLVVPSEVVAKSNELDAKNKNFKFRKSKMTYEENEVAYADGMNEGKSSVRSTRITTDVNALPMKI